MKKWVFFICALLVVALICIYLFIPSISVVSRVVLAKCKAGAAFPIISKDSNWNRWWPSGEGGDKVAAGGGAGADGRAGAGSGAAGGGAEERIYAYRGMAFRLTRLSYGFVDVRIGDAGGADGFGAGRADGRGYESRLSIIPLGSLDSIYLRWECSVPAGMNPVRRVRQYLAAREIGRNMSELLGRLSAFLGKEENVYGVEIREGSTTDSSLVATKSVFPGYPSTDDIYGLLHKVRDYLEQGGAKQTGYPMMNVTPLNTKKDSFRVMVAIPVDKRLPGKGDIYFMRLIPGRYLIGDVKGGKYAVDRALNGFREYILDHQRTVMAIPFESLITDRSRETDSSRWETRIYYPIF